MSNLRRALMMPVVLAPILVGCGASTKMNAAKLAQVKTAAVAGICVQDTMGARKGGQMARIATPAEIADGIAIGFDRRLPNTLGKIAVTSHAIAAAKPNVPHGEVPKHLTCRESMSPFIPKGANPKPDGALMSKMAEALGVDAVVAVMAAPGAELSSSSKIFSGTFNPSYLYMVDRSGEIIVQIKWAGEASAKDDAEAATLFGEELAKGLAAKLAAP